eukprot:CAMPEP_0184396892 /NCGR_PEP_ID=MMETSP0007-20130409/56202_1 /TAXON_ID=97485 /ORGANISM="Prymnesium parvum, Strain Texoma1" /LENGTH=99 /DNA_ID=CAMNT_0026750007 /DNA_START=80 /DNA_END=379 /DNA_ORIENTATION=-
MKLLDSKILTRGNFTQHYGLKLHILTTVIVNQLFDHGRFRAKRADDDSKRPVRREGCSSATIAHFNPQSSGEVHDAVRRGRDELGAARYALLAHTPPSA